MGADVLRHACLALSSISRSHIEMLRGSQSAAARRCLAVAPKIKVPPDKGGKKQAFNLGISSASVNSLDPAAGIRRVPGIVLRICASLC
jgi:hypothetical protein